MEQILTIEEWRSKVFELAEKYNIPGVVFAGMNYGRYSIGDSHYTYSAIFNEANACAAYERSWINALSKIEERLKAYHTLQICPTCLQPIKK